VRLEHDRRDGPARRTGSKWEPASAEVRIAGAPVASRKGNEVREKARAAGEETCEAEEGAWAADGAVCAMDGQATY